MKLNRFSFFIILPAAFIIQNSAVSENIIQVGSKIRSAPVESASENFRLRRAWMSFSQKPNKPGGKLKITVSGLPAGAPVNNATTDISTTPTAINFGVLPMNKPRTAAQRLTVESEGQYRVFVVQKKKLESEDGATINGFKITPEEFVSKAKPRPKETLDVVYQIEVGPDQEIGNYAGSVMYLLVPVHNF